MTTTGTKTTCANPKCTCDPCTCDECHCGGTHLGELERRVMEVLWEAAAPLTGREVADQLPGYAYTTVATVLTRLSRKGQVHRSDEGRTIRFSATGTAGSLAAQAMREALEQALDPADALARFVAAMPDDELQVLRAAIGAADLGRR